jgi:hypothetical protein
MDVLSSGNQTEIEITTSEPIKPQTQVITGPDRLIVDFPGAVPDARLHNLAVNRGEVKGIRVGLFSQHPPTTRVVFDLKAAPSYQIFPSGRTLIVKLGSATPTLKDVSLTTSSTTTATSAATANGAVTIGGIGTVTGGTVTPLTAPKRNPVASAGSAPDVRVNYQNGKLSIWADKATLAAVLYEVQRRTGAQVSVPPAAAQEKIVADIAPAPAREALTSLLNGSNFDFILMGSEKDPQGLQSIVLTPRSGGDAGDQAFFPAVQSPPDTQPQDAQPDAQPDIQPDTQPDGQAEPPPDVQTTPEPQQPDMVPQPQPDNSQQ